MRRAAVLLCIAATACFGGGSGTPVAPDPTAGPACPPEHLAVAARATAFDADPMIVRFDADLGSCQGLRLRDVRETLWVVGGMPDGSELLGLDGRIMRVREGDVVWSQESSGIALDVFHVAIAGTSHAAVVWGASSGSGGDRLEVRDAESGEVVKTYDVSYDTIGAAPSLDRADRIALLDRYDGFAEVQIDLGADALGGATELDVTAPRGLGEASAIATAVGMVVIATRDGILHWTPESPSMLGPATCRWARFTDETVPESCEYRGVAFDRGAGGTFLTTCDGTLVTLDTRDGCATILPAGLLQSHEITDLSWTGD